MRRDGDSNPGDDNVITINRKNDSKPSKAKHGLYRALFFNMIEGVSKG